MTGRVKGIIFSIILVVIALLLMPLAIDAVHDARTDTIVSANLGQVVAGGATNVVLTHALYRGLSTDVVSITSATTGVTPAFNTWTAGTLTLNVDGLGGTTPQDITVTYDYDAVSAYAGVGAITGLVPLLLVVGIILVAVINGLWTLKTKE